MEEGLHIVLAPEKLGYILGVPITNTLITSWIVIAGLLLFAALIGGRLKVVPGRVQNAVEMAFEYVFGYVESALGNHALAKRYFPLIATIFLFLLAANFFEFLPLVGTVGVTHPEGFVPFLHSVNADLNTPLALAIISFFVVEVSGILTLGALKYGSKFVNFKGGAMGFAIGLLEIISELARLVSLSFRLFGTIFAGEVLLLVIQFFVPYVAPVPLMAFEVFIGLLQAAIFAILTLAYIKLAVEEPHSTGSGHAHGSGKEQAHA